MYTDDFLEVWAAMSPRKGIKQGKMPAFKIWQKKKPPKAECIAMLEALKKTDQWRNGYVPDLRKLLHNDFWLDDPPFLPKELLEIDRSLYVTQQR